MVPIARAQAIAQFDLPVQPLADSLRAVGSQTNTNVLFDPPLVAGRKAPALRAALTTDQALSRLLAGTGIAHDFINDKTVVLSAAAPGSTSGTSGSPANSSTTAQSVSAGGGDGKEKEGKNAASAAFRLAQLDQGKTSNDVAAVKQTSSAEKDGDFQLEDIVVTAQKRAENVQDVPKEVDVVNQDKMLQAGVTQIQDLSKIAPSVLGLPTPGGFPNPSAPPAIRGISTFSFTIGVQAQTGIVLDDVPLPTFSTIATDLSDVSQIEVLAGPQSTLTGRNAAGGLINITTQTPTDQFHGNATIEQTDDRQTRFTGYVSGPIIGDTLVGSISGYVDDWSGDVRNLKLADDYTEGYHNNGARLKLLWHPADDWTVTLGAFYTHGNLPSLSPVLSGPYITGAPFNIGTDAIYTETETTETTGATFRIDHDLSIGTLSSITSYSHSIIDAGGGGFGTLIYAFNGQNSTSDYTTQEFRLVSSPSSQLTYLGGLIYTDSDIFNQYSRPTFDTTVYNQSAGIKSVALYGRATWNFTDATSITAGLRGQHDNQNYRWQFVDVPGGTPGPDNTNHFSSGSSDYSFVSGELSLQHAFTSDVKSYVTFAHSQTGRAYDLGDLTDALAGTLQPLRSETVNDVEVGVKTQWFDRRLTLNADGFFAHYENYQIQALSESLEAIPIIRLLSVGAVETKGAEITSALQATKNLAMSLNFAYTDAVITSYKNASCYFEQTVAGGCIGGFQNLSGATMPAAPRVSLNGSLNYTVPLNSVPFDLQLGVFGRYQTKEHFDLYGSPESDQSGYGIMNLTMGLHSHNQHYILEGFVNNIFNTHYYGYLSQDPFSPTPLVIAQYGRDSFQYGGVRLRVQF